ncbi:MAG: hypothetical protein RL494_633 [Bacteroidota bacterium]|jgi:hypothetical protein
MKTLKTILLILISFQFGSCQSKKVVVDSTKTEKKIEKKQSKFAEGKMANGTYFIINANENEALEPFRRTYTSLNDLNLVPLDNSAIQKWVFKENINPKTQKPNGTFSIYLFVDQSNAITNKWNNPRLGKTREYPKDSFVIEYHEGEKAYTIKSTSAKGDCMGKKGGSFAKYVPNDGGETTFWKFQKTE